MGVIENSLKEIPYGDIKEKGNQSFDSGNGWLGITDKYWLVALVPDQAQPIAARFGHTTQNGTDLYQTDYRGDALAADTLAAMGSYVGAGTPPEPDRITVAVPAHWGPATVGALRGALRNRRELLVNGAAPVLVSDAAAALAALQAGPGLPGSGVVVLCDFGGSGTTLAVATGRGHHAIGIDLDPRNVELARDRVGPMFLDEFTLDQWKNRSEVPS